MEQDSPEHVMSCENVILRCPTGFRLARPEFGIPEILFRNVPLDFGELETALRRFEPRGKLSVQQWASQFAPEGPFPGLTLFPGPGLYPAALRAAITAADRQVQIQVES